MDSPSESRQMLDKYSQKKVVKVHVQSICKFFGALSTKKKMFEFDVALCRNILRCIVEKCSRNYNPSYHGKRFKKKRCMKNSESYLDIITRLFLERFG